MSLFARLGDINVELTVDLTDDDGPVNLTTATLVTFSAYVPGTSTPTITGAAVKGDQGTNPGRVTYTLTAANLSAPTTAMIYEVVWIVTWGDGSRDTFPRPGRDRILIGTAAN